MKTTVETDVSDLIDYIKSKHSSKEEFLSMLDTIMGLYRDSKNKKEKPTNIESWKNICK